MQLSGQKSTTKKKQSGLNRLKTGKAATLDAPKEETKGGDSSESAAALQAQIVQLQRDLAQAQASAGGDVSNEDLSTTPVLGYWKIRGLAAQIRYMFYYLKVNFADRLYE